MISVNPYPTIAFPLRGVWQSINSPGHDRYYVFMAHLKQGSLTVSEGRHLATGQLVGEVGDSGFTLELHLHLQLMDQVDNLMTSKAVPFRFRAFEQWDGENWCLKENAFREKGVPNANASI